MPLSGVAGMLWTRLMLADPSFGQAVPRPIRHEHVVWEVHPVSGELDVRGLGDGSLRHGRTKQLARGSWVLALLNEDVKVTAKLHGPLPGIHQNITLEESCFFCGTCGTSTRWAAHLLHGLLERASLLDETPGVQQQRQFIHASTWRRIWKRIDEIGPHSKELSEEPRDDAACARRHNFSVADAGERAGDEQMKKGSALHPSVAQIEQSYSEGVSFLGWSAKFLGRLHTYVKFRD